MARYRDSLLLIVASALSAFVAYVDLRSDDMFIIIGLLSGCAFVLGFVQPDAPWRWGIIMGLGIPVAETIARLSGLPLPYTTEPPTLIGTVMVYLVCFGLAFGGAFSGVLVRRVILSNNGDF